MSGSWRGQWLAGGPGGPVVVNHTEWVAFVALRAPSFSSVDNQPVTNLDQIISFLDLINPKS